MIYNKFSEALQHRLVNRSALLNPVLRLRKSIEKLYNANDLNICYNKFIKQSYHPSKQNILIAIESPAYFEQYNWIDPKMTFCAEISFENYFQLDHYLCPRTIYASSDYFVNMPQTFPHSKKTNLVSMVYSDKQIVSGHKIAT